MLRRVDSDRTSNKRCPLQTIWIMSGRNLGSPDDIGIIPTKKIDIKGPTSKELSKGLKSEH